MIERALDSRVIDGPRDAVLLPDNFIFENILFPSKLLKGSGYFPSQTSQEV
jgi:hypothetical protein